MPPSRRQYLDTLTAKKLKEEAEKQKAAAEEMARKKAAQEKAKKEHKEKIQNSKKKTKADNDKKRRQMLLKLKRMKEKEKQRAEEIKIREEKVAAMRRELVEARKQAQLKKIEEAKAKAKAEAEKQAAKEAARKAKEETAKAKAAAAAEEQGGGGDDDGNGDDEGEYISSDDEDEEEDHHIWKKSYDPNTGREYYYNKITGASQWDVPYDLAWTSVLDSESGKTYYYNEETGETRWTMPDSDDDSDSDDSDSGSDDSDSDSDGEELLWQEATDPNTGKVYYFNTETEAVQWTKPAEMEEQEGARKKHAKADYDVQLCKAMCLFLCNALAGEEGKACKDLLPDPKDSASLFAAADNGILLCHLLNAVSPGSLDVRALNVGSDGLGKDLNNITIRENLNLCVNAARNFGCVFGDKVSCLVKKDGSDKARRHAILLFLSEVARVTHVQSKWKAFVMSKQGSLPTLLKEDEEVTEVLKMRPSELILRWVNFHTDEECVDFGASLKSNLVLGKLLARIVPDSVHVEELEEQVAAAEKEGAGTTPLAATMIKVLDGIEDQDIFNSSKFVSEDCICTENESINLPLYACLMRYRLVLRAKRLSVEQKCVMERVRPPCCSCVPSADSPSLSRSPSPSP